MYCKTISLRMYIKNKYFLVSSSKMRTNENYVDQLVYKCNYLHKNEKIKNNIQHISVKIIIIETSVLTIL